MMKIISCAAVVQARETTLIGGDYTKHALEPR